MKFIKYIAAALLLTVGFASCNNGGDDMGDGTVGKTTVQFAQAEYESGYGTGMVKVPVTITADKEEDMNSCNVSVKIKPVITGEEYEGTHDETGKPGAGDYAVTSWNLNFPAYANYYDKKDPTKYYDEATQKWTKTVNLEVKIVNSESDELHINFEIESVTEGVTIGENKQCKVVLKKTTRDRMCGVFTVSYDEIAWYDDTDPEKYPVEGYAWTAIETSWYIEADCFLMMADLGIPLWAYYDAATEQMFFYPEELLTLVDQTNNIAVASMMWDTDKEAVVEDNVYTEWNMEEGTITFPENIAIRFQLYSLDAEMKPVECLGDALPGYKGVKFTKVK